MDKAGLTQEDFRKLIATPRPDAKKAEPEATAAAAAVDGFAAPAPKKKKKKWEKLTKEEQAALAKRKAEEKALRDKYRDRAAERRKGENRDYADHESLLDAYKNAKVAPSVEDAEITAREKRLRDIEESKFLGGDVEHTHLVKGLDFALLQKIRSEREGEEGDGEADTREGARAATATAAAASSTSGKSAADQLQAVSCRTKVGRGVWDVLFTKAPPKKNELFAPGRMAYLVDLEDRNRQSMDAPTTVIRSKADVAPVSSAKQVSNNDIVINKLCQILSYLRTGTRPSKRRKVNKKKRPSLDRATVAPTSEEGSSPNPRDSTPSASAADAPAAAADADLDLFGGVVTSSSAVDDVSASRLLADKGKGSYFGDKSQPAPKANVTADATREEGAADLALPGPARPPDSGAAGAALPPKVQAAIDAAAAAAPPPPVVDPDDSEDDGILPLVLSAPVGKMSRKERRKLAKGGRGQKRGATNLAEDEYSAYYPGGKQDPTDGYDVGSDEEREDIRAENKAMAKGKGQPSRSEMKQKLNNDLSAINKFIEKRRAERDARDSGKSKKVKVDD